MNITENELLQLLLEAYNAGWHGTLELGEDSALGLIDKFKAEQHSKEVENKNIFKDNLGAVDFNKMTALFRQIRTPVFASDPEDSFSRETAVVPETPETVIVSTDRETPATIRDVTSINDNNVRSSWRPTWEVEWPTLFSSSVSPVLSLSPTTTTATLTITPIVSNDAQETQ